MKYPECRCPHIKAKVALRAIKGESVSYLSRTYHVNLREIGIWKRQLLNEMYVQEWMVRLFMKKPALKKEDSELF